MAADQVLKRLSRQIIKEDAVKAPLNYSVFVDAAAALLLAA